MNDYWRESLSYFGLFKLMRQQKKDISPEKVTYGPDKEQYFHYYEPETIKSDKIIFWVHGGGWNAGNPEDFDYVGQAVAREGYRMISVGYRLSTKYKYPAQIEDVCRCFTTSMEYLKKKGIDTSKVIIAGPSAGAHLSSILCFSDRDRELYGVDVSGVIGYVGWGGPYCFKPDMSWTLKLLLKQLFTKDYDRNTAEPIQLMCKRDIPMLLIQSKHDGLIDYACAEDFAGKAEELGMSCELYSVMDEKDTHSWYTAGMFMLGREENKGLDKFYSWIEAL